MTAVSSQGAASARLGGRARSSQPLWAVLQRFVVVLLAVIFGALVAGPGRGTAKVIAAAFDAAPAAAARVDRTPGPASSDLSRAWQSGAPSRPADLEAVESDGGDEDEPLPVLEEHGTASSLCCVPALGKPAYVLRGALLADTSRFAGSPRLPRGPPAS